MDPMPPTNEEKKRVWDAYRARRPIRVPVTFGVNPRVVLLDPDWNTGVTSEEYFSDPQALVEVQLKFLQYQVEYLNQYCDSPMGWPESFDFYVDVQNTYDSAYFGAPVELRAGQVVYAAPVLAGADRDRIFSVDVEHPMDNPFVRRCMKRHAELTEVVGRTSFRGLRLGVRPLTWGYDGPLTIATSLRGSELYSDLYEDPDYAARLMDFITRAVIARNRAMCAHFGLTAFNGKNGGIADDSVQLISTAMYREVVMPLHRLYLSQWSVEGPHGIHLCGDATRHFPTIRDELHVMSFDTGFPVDHGALRKALGPEVEVAGGPEAPLLLGGTPEQVYERTRGILLSGVMEGGRFILREANNLPPRCPEANLAAMYRACLEHGGYPDAAVAPPA
jgi:uroporphyrinogen-III decarboxylase